LRDTKESCSCSPGVFAVLFAARPCCVSKKSHAHVLPAVKEEVQWNEIINNAQRDRTYAKWKAEKSETASASRAETSRARERERASSASGSEVLSDFVTFVNVFSGWSPQLNINVFGGKKEDFQGRVFEKIVLWKSLVCRIFQIFSIQCTEDSVSSRRPWWHSATVRNASAFSFNASGLSPRALGPVCGFKNIRHRKKEKTFWRSMHIRVYWLCEHVRLVRDHGTIIFRYHVGVLFSLTGS